MAWADFVRDVIASIRFAPYARGGNGVTKDVLWRKTDILRADSPPHSYCSGAQFEAFVAAMKLAGLEDDDRFDVGWMRKAQRASYCRMDVDPAYQDGLPGFLVREGLAAEVKPEEAQFGDAVQIQWDMPDHPEDGHALWAVDRNFLLNDGGGTVTNSPNGSSDQVIWCWSSNYAQKAQYGLPARSSGHMTDYFKLLKSGRIFHVARPSF